MCSAKGAGSWPPGVPVGTKSYWQYWVADPGAIVNFAASNGMEAEAQ